MTHFKIIEMLASTVLLQLSLKITTSNSIAEKLLATQIYMLQSQMKADYSGQMFFAQHY